MIDADVLLGGALVEDPYPFYAELREHAPVWQVPGANAYFVSTWELVTEATGRPADFSNHFRHTLFTDERGALGVLYSDGSGAPDVLAGADPPEHTAHRKLFFSELAQRKMAALEDDVRTLTDALLDGVIAQQRVDVMRAFANELPLWIVSERVIGFRDTDIALMQQWVFAGSRFMGGRLRFEDMGAVAERAAGIMPWVAGQLHDALDGDDRDDVLSAAAGAVRTGRLTRDEAAFTLMVLVGAGAETTTALIGNAIRILAERPVLQTQLRAHPELVPDLVEEVLRYESPFRFHPKSTEHEVELGGVAIPPQAMVALLWGAANRDDTVFERADQLVVGRPDVHLHLGFGRGVHHCVGAPLARLEARIALTRLLEATSAFALVDGEPPQWVDSLWTRRHERLPIEVEPAR